MKYSVCLFLSGLFLYSCQPSTNSADEPASPSHPAPVDIDENELTQFLLESFDAWGTDGETMLSYYTPDAMYLWGDIFMPRQVMDDVFPGVVAEYDSTWFDLENVTFHPLSEEHVMASLLLVGGVMRDTAVTEIESGYTLILRKEGADYKIMYAHEGWNAEGD